MTANNTRRRARLTEALKTLRGKSREQLEMRRNLLESQLPRLSTIEGQELSLLYLFFRRRG